MPLTQPEAVRAIEDAIAGITGAAYNGDVAYAQRRRQDIYAALGRLQDTDLPAMALLAKVQRLYQACCARAFARAVELNQEITLLLQPFK